MDYTICSKVIDYAKDNPELYKLSNTSQTGIASMFFANRANICLNDGTWFGSDDYRGYVRFNYGTSLEDIKTALDKIKKAVDFLINKYSN